VRREIQERISGSGPRVVGWAVEEDVERLGEGGCAGSGETCADDLELCAGFRCGWLLTHVGELYGFL
jgi:hypothetical protein